MSSTGEFYFFKVNLFFNIIKPNNHYSICIYIFFSIYKEINLQSFHENIFLLIRTLILCLIFRVIIHKFSLLFKIAKVCILLMIRMIYVTNLCKLLEQTTKSLFSILQSIIHTFSLSLRIKQ